MLIFCFEKINLLPTSIHLFVVHAQELLSIKHYENIKKDLKVLKFPSIIMEFVCI